jgi:hypothetical protein
MKTAPYKARQDRIEGRKFLANMAATVKQLWEKACEFDGIPADSTFVVWSAENKFGKFYNIAINQYMDAQREYEAGGYVGVRIA